jgi:hypothetical protein
VSSHFGFKIGLVQRSKGQKAVKRSAYQCRGSARLSDDSVVDYSDRGDDHVAHFIVAPEGAPAWALDRSLRCRVEQPTDLTHDSPKSPFSLLDTQFAAWSFESNHKLDDL